MTPPGVNPKQLLSFQPATCFSLNSFTAECQGLAGCELSIAVCLWLSLCSSCVSIDPRRVESGDGTVARRDATHWSVVSVFPEEASKCRFSD